MESNAGRVLYHGRRYDQAIDRLNKVLALDPTRVYARVHLAMSYEEKGLYAQERRELDRITEQFGQTGVGWAHFCAVTGRPTEARQVLDTWRRKGDNTNWFFFGGIFAALGEKDEAFACLEKAFVYHDFFLSYMLVHPWMDPLRSDPRFTAMLQRIGLTPIPK